MNPSSELACNEDGTITQSLMLGCYCQQVLKQEINDKGVLDAVSALAENEGDLCLEFATAFAASQSSLAGAVLVVAFTNFAVKIILDRLSRFERHESVTAESVSLTLKIFFAQFLNTGIIIILVNGKLPNNIDFPLASVVRECSRFALEHSSQ